MITCPADFAVNTDAGVCGAAVTFAAQHSDNCSSTIAYSHASGSVFPVGTTTVTATATDPAGNSTSCSFDIVVTDNEAPVIACPADIAVNTDAGVCGAAVSYAATSTDNCSSTMAYSHASGSVFPVGTTTVTATATDPAGNSTSCSFDIVVSDNEVPAAICQDHTIYLDANGQASIVASDIDGGSTDNCGVQSISASQTLFDCTEVGANNVTLTVVDVNGNSSQCTAIVTVIDNIAPVISNMPADIEVCGSQAVTWNIATASDNCLTSFDSDHHSGDVFPVGVTVVTYTANDAGGNVVQASFSITVRSLLELVIVQNQIPDFCQGLTLLTTGVNNTGDLLAPLTYVFNQWSRK